MLSPYRRVLSLPGAIAFSGAAFVARMPISMLSLGIVLLVAGRTGSYGYAGGIAAAYILANAVAAPVQGRLTDRLGQARVLPVSITAFGVALAALMAAVQGDAPVPLPHLIAVLVGVALPQVGSSVRARWAHLLRERPQRQRDLHTAYAFESVVDEAIFITGPVLVTLLATAVHPLAGLSAALVAAVSGTFLLAAQRSTEPPVDRRAHAGDAREPLGWRILLPVALTATALGTLFGSTEVVTVAFTEQLGRQVLAGPLLATWALGSLPAGVATGSVPWRASPTRRLRLGAGAMACAMLPLPFVTSLPALGAALFVAGFAIAPTLIAMVAVVEAHVPASRLTEGISWSTTGLTAGIAPGAAVAGRLVDRDGTSAGFTVPLAAGVVAVRVALFVRSAESGHP